MKKTILFLFLIGLSYSCSKDFVDLNTDKKRPANVPPGALFAFATKTLSNTMASSNVNLNIFRLMGQYWTETTYFDESQYDLATRNIPQNVWYAMYRDVLKNLNESQLLIPAQGAGVVPAVQQNQNACAEILNVYTYMVLVNTFGDVPYTEALDYRNVTPE